MPLRHNNGMLKKDNPGFVQCPCKGPLAKFRSRGIYAIAKMGLWTKRIGTRIREIETITA